MVWKELFLLRWLDRVCGVSRMHGRADNKFQTSDLTRKPKIESF